MIGVVLILVGCGEDRTYEYQEKTEPNHYLQTMMQEWYLWGDSLKDLKWGDYFAVPSEFVKKLAAQSPQGDKWSYCSIDTINMDYHPRGTFSCHNSYGMDLVLMTDPTGETTKQYARVITVYPGSPAEKGGVRRNDFISQMDHVKMSKTNISKLSNGINRTLIVSRIKGNEDGTLAWAYTDTIPIGRSEQVDVPQIMVSKMIDSKMAYIMVTHLNETQPLRSALETLFNSHPQELIVDFRLCNQGTLEAALDMARMIANHKGDFIHTKWNSHKSSNDAQYTIEASCDCNIYFITSSYTQGAAEWLIHAMQTDEGHRVVTVGQKTAGQNVMLKAYPSPYYYTLYPAVAYVGNDADDYDYSSGIVPDLAVDEMAYAMLYPYGDKREVIINTILDNF